MSSYVSEIFPTIDSPACFQISCSASSVELGTSLNSPSFRPFDQNISSCNPVYDYTNSNIPSLHASLAPLATHAPNPNLYPGPPFGSDLAERYIIPCLPPTFPQPQESITSGNEYNSRNCVFFYPTPSDGASSLPSTPERFLLDPTHTFRLSTMPSLHTTSNLRELPDSSNLRKIQEDYHARLLEMLEEKDSVLSIQILL